MKMAKASKDDIRKVIEFFRFIEEFMEYGTHTPDNEEIEEDSIDLTDEKFVEMLRALWGGRFKPAGVDCMWSRVVFGCDMLIDNCCDPDVDVLEWKPELAQLIDPPDGLDEVVNCLHGSNKEHFRSVLMDKVELLANVCDYAARRAARERVEPWSVIKRLTSHGSGVSSAIYELYRRKEVPVKTTS